MPRLLLRDLLWLLGAAAIAVGLELAFGLDLRVARSLHGSDPGAWRTVSRYAVLPSVVVSIGFAVVAISGLLAARGIARLNGPLAQECARVWLATVLVGSMIIVQGVRLTSNRPRPWHTLEVAGVGYLFRYPYDPPFDGEGVIHLSFPSSKASLAYAFCSLYFPLRRRHRTAAWAMLGGGLAWGSLAGYSRMAIGSHFPSDVVAAAVLTLLAAVAAAHVRLTARWSGV